MHDHALIAEGQERGFLTIEQIATSLEEVEITKEQSLNEVFAELSAARIEVLSMRNKVNRLEEIFMRLVEKRDNGKVASA